MVGRIKENAEKWKDLPGELFAYKADVCSEPEIVAAYDFIEKHVGPIHILVNNAGVLYTAPLLDGDVELWRKTLEVNVLAVAINTKQAIKRMRANAVDGHIIQIDSIAGHYVPYIEGLDLNIYPATKFAVRALTETFRQELNAVDSAIKVTVSHSGSNHPTLFS